MNTLMLGADPELFLQDASGALISAIGRIGGTKEIPRPLPIGEGFAIQEDNVALEYNIPASDSKFAFQTNIAKAMSHISDQVARQKLKFSNLSAAYFTPDQLADPRALEFGCEPDYNAWRNGAKNPRPKAADKHLRTAGGHVHVGYKFTDHKEVIQFMKHMDLHLGVASVIMDQGELRKELYGKAGAFRYKPYGGEYRVLSNFWVLEPKLVDWVWEATWQALTMWQNNQTAINEDADLIQLAINKNNKDVAWKLINKYNLLMA